MDIKAFRGLSGTYNVRANERDRGAPKNIECLVQFLNNTQHKFIVDRQSKGQCLLDSVFKYLNLIETDFFGLKYLPQESRRQIEINNNIEGSNNNVIASLKCNNNSNNNHNNSTLLSKTQSLNSYNHSPSSNTSLSSSSAGITTNATSTDNHHKLTQTDPPTNGNNNNYINSPSTSPTITLAAAAANHSTISNATDDNNITSIEERWLDPTKSIRKQYKSGPPYKFYFRVKFYVSEPSKLADDTTRHHLYLQLRQDILNNRLIISTDSAILLASYILQSEVGDYKKELQEDYASNFKLLPNLSDDIKRKVIELHKQHKSLSSADAEYQFLEHAAKQLDCYGVEFYEAKDSSKQEVQVGVSSNDIKVFKDSKKISQFSWADIIKIMFKKKIFSIQLKRNQGPLGFCDNLIGNNNLIEYNLLTNQACKSFWEECVAQHSFFRLHQPKSPPKKFFSFLNFGSRFQYNGKTEYQTMEESRKRSFSHFSRTPSKRYARRTIPIGRPSWSESASDKKVSTTDDTDCRDSNHANHGGEMENSRGEKVDLMALNHHYDSKANNNHSTWLFIGSSTTRSADDADHLLNNVSMDSRLPSAYRPKSLTLKSFMYIDDSKNVSSGEHSQVSTFDKIQSANRSSEILDNGLDIQPNDETMKISTKTNVFKKDLKRSESLKLSNSIKGAISLTKKAGASSGNHLAKISESLRDKFLVGKSKSKKSPSATSSLDIKTTTRIETLPEVQDSDDLDETNSEICSKTIRLVPGEDGKYGIRIKKIVHKSGSDLKASQKYGLKVHSIIIKTIFPNTPAANSNPKLSEGDQIVTINGLNINGMTESEVGTLIRRIQQEDPPNLDLQVISRNADHMIDDTSSSSQSMADDASSSNPSNSKQPRKIITLADSIKEIKRKLEGEKRELIEDFDKLSRKKEDETLDESKSSENIDKNRYRDILPYDSTRVQLTDSMTGDYINASFVNMHVPSGQVNRYIATQGPLASTCDDFWQMVWEQNSSLIIMVTPLIESGRVKCHKYWPDEKEDVRYGQILVRNLSEKSKSATIDRTIQLVDVKSGEKRVTTQIQYKAWPDHEVPEDCSDFLSLVNRVRKHRLSKPEDPIVVHCSAGIGRTGVLILMETAICIMESNEPVFPISILQDMRKQRAMLIQTNSQFQFVADAICKVYDQKLYKKKKHKKK